MASAGTIYHHLLSQLTSMYTYTTTHYPMGRPGTILPVTMNVHSLRVSLDHGFFPSPIFFRGQVHLVIHNRVLRSSLGVPISFECPRCNVFVWVDLRRIDFESVGRGDKSLPYIRISVYHTIIHYHIHTIYPSFRTSVHSRTIRTTPRLVPSHSSRISDSHVVWTCTTIYYK